MFKGQPITNNFLKVTFFYIFLAWYQLEDYEVDGIKRQLLCRLATNKDVKNMERTGRDSEYYKWLLNKKKFHSNIKKRAFHEIRKTKQIEKR